MAVNSFKLTKLVCLGSLGCITVASLYYHNNKDTDAVEHLQQQQFRNQRIESLTAQNENLKSQLGSVQLPISGTLVCPDGKKIKNKDHHWSNRTFTLSCVDESKQIKNIFSSDTGEE